MEITVIAHPRGEPADHEMAGFRAMDMDDIAGAYKGRPLYVDHGHERGEKPIGRIVRAWRGEDDDLRMTCRIDDEERGRAAIFKDKMLHVSVGYDIAHDSPIKEEQTKVVAFAFTELSLVRDPAHPDAAILAVRDQGKLYMKPSLLGKETMEPAPVMVRTTEGMVPASQPQAPSQSTSVAMNAPPPAPTVDELKELRKYREAFAAYGAGASPADVLAALEAKQAALREQEAAAREAKIKEAAAALAEPAVTELWENPADVAPYLEEMIRNESIRPMTQMLCRAAKKANNVHQENARLMANKAAMEQAQLQKDGEIAVLKARLGEQAKEVQPTERFHAPPQPPPEPKRYLGGAYTQGRGPADLLHSALQAGVSVANSGSAGGAPLVQSSTMASVQSGSTTTTTQQPAQELFGARFLRQPIEKGKIVQW